MAIEPVENLADQIRPRHEIAMPAVEEYAALVGVLRPERAEQWQLIGSTTTPPGHA